MQIPEYINLKHTSTQKSIPPLKLSMQMLLDEFTERDFEPLFYNGIHDKMKLDNVMLYYGQDTLEESVVYLCEEQTLTAHPIKNHDICLLLTGHKKPLFPDLKNPFLFFSDQEPAVILNLASEFFRKYRNFEIDLYEALYTGGLSALSSVALAFFKNPILIHDEKFMVLSRPQFVSGMTETNYDKDTGFVTFKLELLNILKQDNDYIKTLSTKGAHFWIKQPLTPYRVPYINLFNRNGKYLGRVLVNEINSIFYPSHIQILEYFAQFATIAITQPQQATDASFFSFELFLQKYLHGDLPSRENALKTLGFCKWQENDAFICAEISIPEQDRRINSVDIMMTSLRLLFTDCYVFIDGSVIWLVENLTANRLSAAAFQKRLKSFARDGAYSIGQSAPFRNFFHLPHAFRQADITLEYGKKKERSFCRSFHEIIGSYLTEKLCETESKETLCHECLFNLMDYDAQKGTDYYKTLQIYLENERNLTITSQILHIHRSTLQYRITKITELLSLPLDDADLRFYLLCCFRIIDYQKDDV